MTYITQPGTIHHQVIERLKTLPPGSEISTSELAWNFGLRQSLMSALLCHLRDHGVVSSKKMPGDYVLWSISSGARP